MKKNGMRIPWLLSLILFSSLCGQAEAKTPWRWQMTLKPELATDAMHMPHGLYVDAEKERYYVADSGNNRLLSFDRKGLLVHSFTANDELKTPSDLIRTKTGELWIIERGRNSLTRIDMANKQTVPHTLTDQGRLVFPDRIEYNENGFYLLDKASGAVLMLDTTLAVRQRFRCPAEQGNGGFVDFILHDNEVWALDQRAKAVYHFQANGEVAGRISLGEEIQVPVSLAIGSQGLLYVLDRLDGVIIAYDRDGRFKYRFLGAGQAQGQLYYPAELRFDPWGQLCVVDEGNGRVEVFSR